MIKKVPLRIALLPQTSRFGEGGILKSTGPRTSVCMDLSAPGFATAVFSSMA